VNARARSPACARWIFWATLAASVFALVVVAGRASADPAGYEIAGYGITATKACLTQHGAVINSGTDPAAATLSAAERLKLVSAVISPSGATGPLFLYLAFGRDAAEAHSIVTRVGKHLLLPPTPTNSVSGAKLNAAWLVESSVGAHPPASATSLVAGCLRIGTAGAAPPRLTLQAVSECLSAHNGAPLDKRQRSLLFPPIPASIARHMGAALVPGDNLGSGQGVFAFVLIGGDSPTSVVLRDKLAALLHTSYPTRSSGASRNAAWLVIPTHRATKAQVKTAKRVFQGCLG
jgi:hypothetical protein